MSNQAKRYHHPQTLCFECGYEGDLASMKSYGALHFCSTTCIYEYVGFKQGNSEFGESNYEQQ